jgi:hypothetical protein
MNRFLFAACILAVVAGEHLGLRLNPNGTFLISYEGQLWFEGGEVAVDGHSSAGDLTPMGPPKSGIGADTLGDYKSMSIDWAFEEKHLITTSFRKYPADEGVIVFEQFFPAALTSAAKASLNAQTIFPGFLRNPGPTDDFSCFSYHGVFPRLHPETVSKYSDSHQGGAPLAIYDRRNASLPMVVFSPLNFPKAHHMASSSSFFGAGVKSTVETIPAGWSQLFILSAGVGINDGMMAWGDRMLKYTGKRRADMYRDPTHATIGFWTDNGGYYHYSTGTNKSATYEEVLPKVKAYHDAIAVPFGHWQFDSWFVTNIVYRVLYMCSYTSAI